MGYILGLYHIIRTYVAHIVRIAAVLWYSSSSSMYVTHPQMVFFCSATLASRHAKSKDGPYDGSRLLRLYCLSVL